MFENGDDLDEIASDWIEKYQQNRSDALKEMINFVLKVGYFSPSAIALDKR